MSGHTASLALDHIGRILAGGTEHLMAYREADHNKHCRKYYCIDPPAYGDLALILLYPAVHHDVAHAESQEG